MNLDLSRKPDNLSASKINPCVLWNPKFHFHFHKNHYLSWLFKWTQSTARYPICKWSIVKITLFWGITSSNLVIVNRRLLGTHCLRLQYRRLSRIGEQQVPGRIWQKPDVLSLTYFVTINVGFLNIISLFCNEIFLPTVHVILNICC
jgi:hypothetical protein